MLDIWHNFGWGGANTASAAHKIGISIPIQNFMSDLYIVDGYGAALAGYYSPDKSISYITGYAYYDTGDDSVGVFVAGFSDSVPVGAPIQVHLSKPLYPGITDFTAYIKLRGNVMYDLQGKKLGNIKTLDLHYSEHYLNKNELRNYNGQYEITLSYNGQVKKITVIINT